MDLIHVWHYDRILYTILRSTIPIPVHDLKVKVTDTECFMLNFIYLATSVDICDMPGQGYFKSWQK